MLKPLTQAQTPNPTPALTPTANTTLARAPPSPNPTLALTATPNPTLALTRCARRCAA